MEWDKDTTYYVGVDKDLTYVVGGAVRDICLDRPVMGWDLARSDAINGFCSEVLAKFGKDCLVSRNRIFFVIWTCGNPARVLPPV